MNNTDDFCPNCGRTLSEIMASSVVGCEVCYYHFSSQLMEIIKQLQSGEKHCGKQIVFSEDYFSHLSTQNLRDLLKLLIDERRLDEANSIVEELEKRGEAI